MHKKIYKLQINTLNSAFHFHHNSLYTVISYFLHIPEFSAVDGVTADEKADVVAVICKNTNK